MDDREVQEAWRAYLLNWLALCLVAQALFLCLAVTTFSLAIGSWLLKVLFAAGLFTAAGHYLMSLKRTWSWTPRLVFIVLSIVQIEVLILFSTPLTYILASANLPMQDANLARLDQLLGLDWQAYYRFVCERPALVPYVYFAYAMIVWPTFGVPIVLGLTKHYLRLQQFTLACMSTVVTTALISSVLPAVGTFHEYGISPDLPVFRASGYLVQLHQLPLVRDGSLRVLDHNTLGGIITFPSFHAAAAVLALWAFWGVWWMRPLALIANVGMLLATPLVGGHYFVDVFAGVALAVLAIAAAQRIGRRSTSTVARNMAQNPAVA
jgi:membrane-associated phospholipid phosphatase